MTSHLTPKRERWLLLTLASIQFTSVLDFMIMMPLGPQLTELFGISASEFGFLVSAYTFSAGLSGLLAATYIDRFGRKRMMLTLYPLFGAAALACSFAPTFAWLLVARVASGFFGGVLMALSQTIVAEVIPFERRGRAMSVVMTSFSVATVAGVPLALFLASHFNWHAPFLAIALMVSVCALGAAKTLPSLKGHLAAHPSGDSAPNMLANLRLVLVDPNHLRAYAMSASMVFAGFAVIPYIALYLQGNAGFKPEQIPYVYLTGGICTLISARLIGHWSDRAGKAYAFRRLALLMPVPLLAMTLSAGLPMVGVLLVSSVLFVVMSGRMIPGMALIGAAADPRRRGSFMTLNSAVQSLAMGLAALVGGQILGRDGNGHLTHYWMAALLGGGASLLSFVLASKLRLHGQTQA
ncbi:MAG: MFS transporter [Limnohabitans sp.]|jgi:predicted MFS family arabinose efflux permease|nr:MFS transporter [Limnohabitans sp.]